MSAGPRVRAGRAERGRAMNERASESSTQPVREAPTEHGEVVR
jgi:hypothetical protein